MTGSTVIESPAIDLPQETVPPSLEPPNHGDAVQSNGLLALGELAGVFNDAFGPYVPPQTSDYLESFK